MRCVFKAKDESVGSVRYASPAVMIEIAYIHRKSNKTSPGKTRYTPRG
jgi:hypothetical protein